MSQKTKNSVLRMPPELHERVKAEAAANGRSMNSEIIARLEKTRTLGCPTSLYDEARFRELLGSTALLQGLHSGGYATTSQLPEGELPAILRHGEYRVTPEQLDTLMTPSAPMPAVKPLRWLTPTLDNNDDDEPPVSLMQPWETQFRVHGRFSGRPLTETMQRLGMKGVISGPKALEGTTWVLTGTLYPGLTKDKAREQLMSLGAVVAGRVTKDTYAVVKGFDAWTIAVQRASFFDVPQLSGAEFHQLMQDLGAIEK